jgi:hypothetical protein
LGHAKLISLHTVFFRMMRLRVNQGLPTSGSGLKAPQRVRRKKMTRRMSNSFPGIPIQTQNLWLTWYWWLDYNRARLQWRLQDLHWESGCQKATRFRG